MIAMVEETVMILTVEVTEVMMVVLGLMAIQTRPSRTTKAGDEAWHEASAATQLNILGCSHNPVNQPQRKTLHTPARTQQDSTNLERLAHCGRVHGVVAAPRGSLVLALRFLRRLRGISNNGNNYNDDVRGMRRPML